MRVSSVIVWDLDGTVYRSQAACRHYGEQIALTMAPERRAPYLDRLDAFLGMKGGLEAADGWEAAVIAAGGRPGDHQAWAEAFAATRLFMLGDGCDLEIPAGLTDLATRLRPAARLVLASNTPTSGVLPLLDRLNLAGLFDEIVCASTKPAGFGQRLAGLAAVYDLPRRAVLSVGDHFGNDIEPALAAGASAAYVDPFGVGPAGRADLEAASLEDLLGPIEG
ncbi:MAG: HAD family hydrolase, partial [Acidimicrobiales bacterium]